MIIFGESVTCVFKPYSYYENIHVTGTSNLRLFVKVN
jgi:hypothetical protein